MGLGPMCRTVLVVEDDRAVRQGLCDLLELEGFTPHAAANGAEALATLEQLDHVCLILLDLMMPVMNGYEFAERLRTHAQLAPIPIVVVTAFDDPARGVGAKAVLRKPVELDVLLALVHRYCRPPA